MTSKDRTKYRYKSDLKGHRNKAFERIEVVGSSEESTDDGYYGRDYNGGLHTVIDSDVEDFYDVTMADIKNRREVIDLRNDTGGGKRNSNNNDLKSDSRGGKRNSNNNNNNVSSANDNKSRNKHVKDNRSDENKIKSQSKTLKPNQRSHQTIAAKSPVPSPTSTTSSNPQQKNILRNAVYYQNRFILLDSPSDATKTNSNSSTIMSQSHDAYDGKSVRMGGRRHQQKSNDGNEETSFSNNKMAERVGGNRKNMEMDASSVTMDARGIEIILTDPENSSRPIATEENKRKNTWLKKINRVLLDNRVKGRNSEIILHRDNPEDNKVLKKVLNFIFLAIGAMLFLSVLICVIYAFAIGEPDNTTGMTRTTTVSP